MLPVWWAAGQHDSDQACFHGADDYEDCSHAYCNIVYSQICSLFKPIQCEIEMKPFSEILIFVGDYKNKRVKLSSKVLFFYDSGTLVISGDQHHYLYLYYNQFNSHESLPRIFLWYWRILWDPIIL